jgi:SAM-dependent methyltransferase
MKPNNQEIQRMYMQTLAPNYTRDIVGPQQEIYRLVNQLLEQRASGETLLIGSGPLVHIQTPNVTRIVAMDYSESMLREMCGNARTTPMCADAAALPFDRGTFDTVVLPFIVHHLGQDSIPSTDMTVRRVVSEATRVLRKGGRLIVVDLFMPQYLELIERGLYEIARVILNMYGHPMMYFYSLSNFTAILNENPLHVSPTRRLEVLQDLVLTLLAPRWRIPARWHPAKFHYVECTKAP